MQCVPGLTAHFVDHYDDVYRLAFEDYHVQRPRGGCTRAQTRVIVINGPGRGRTDAGRLQG